MGASIWQPVHIEPYMFGSITDFVTKLTFATAIEMRIRHSVTHRSTNHYHSKTRLPCLKPSVEVIDSNRL